MPQPTKINIGKLTSSLVNAFEKSKSGGECAKKVAMALNTELQPILDAILDEVSTNTIGVEDAKKIAKEAKTAAASAASAGSAGAGVP